MISIFDVLGEDFGFDFQSTILDALGSSIVEGLSTVIGKALYYIVDDGLLRIVNLLYKLFAVFAGISRVEYDGEKDFLINVFFSNTTISNIYWGMALLGIIMIFVFAIISILKKMFDLYDKQQRSIGQILTSSLKSFLIILLLSTFVTLIMNATNVLMQRVNYIFDHADSLTQKHTITFTDQQYATMARCLETIGNYSMNPSYDSRYNINSCFNDIRGDLYLLQQEGVFDVFYETKDDDGNTINTWQSVLESISYSGSLKKDLKMDLFYSEISESIINAMDIMKKNDASFKPLKSYERTITSSQNVPLDRILFLIGTTDAAKNDGYNQNPSFTDSLRAPYFTGEKSIYDIDSVMESFEIRLGGMSYILVAVLALLTLQNLLRCIVQCVVRIFSLLGLYIIAPPFVATMPLDDGEKFKQWMTAFIIQTFGIFGTVIPMRLLITFIPMILSQKLVIFADSALLNLLAKCILLVGGFEAVNRFGGIVTGILANNASHQAINAGNTDMLADSIFKKGIGGVGKVAGVAASAAGFAATVTGLSTVGNKISKTAGDAYQSMKENGGIVGALGKKISGSKDNDKDKEKEKELPKNNNGMGKK